MNIGTWLSLSMLIASACRTTDIRDEAPLAAIDHLIIGVSNLDEGIAAFTAATGVVAVRGGKHPTRGTENALVALGNGTYLEIIAPQAEAPDDNPMVKSLRALTKPTTVGWALRVNDAPAVRARLVAAGFEVTEPRPGSRRTPSGEMLEWTTFGLAKEASDAVPFLIQWSAATPHPSATSPAGCVLESFEIQDPEAATISRFVNVLGVNVPVHAAARTNMIIALQCGGRRAEFRTE